MANLLDWFKKEIHDVGNAIGGATHAVGQAVNNEVHQAPQQVGQAVHALSNVANATARTSNNFSAPLIQSFVKPVIRGGNVLSQTQNNINAGRPVLNGVNLRQFGADTLQTGLNFSPAIGLKLVGPGSNLATKAGARFINGLPVGGGVSVASDLLRGEHDPGKIAFNAGANALGVGGTRAAAPVLKDAARATTEQVAKDAKAGFPTLANQTGAVGKNVSGGKITPNNARTIASYNTSKPVTEFKVGDKVTHQTSLGQVTGIITKAPDFSKDLRIKGNNFELKLDKPLATTQGDLTKLKTDGASFTQKSAQPKPTIPSTVAEPKVPQLKTRGFSDNITKANAVDQHPTAEIVAQSIPGYKPITNKATMAKATAAVEADPTLAYAKIITKPQLTSADDVATGNLILKRAIESGDIKTAVDVGTKLGVDGTKLGQAIQAYSTYKRTTPEGVVTYASKKAGAIGRELDPIKAQELVTAAQKIAEMPEGLEKAKATRDLLTSADKVGRNWRSTLGDILATPRAAMATADLSAPLRQGAILGSRFPKEFAKAFGAQIKYFVSPGTYEKEMYALTQRPSYALMKHHKLAVGGAEQLTGTEEQFLGNLLESKAAKKLGVGHIVAASDRAYTGFLTKLRADTFDKVVGDSQKLGVNLDGKALDSLTKFINSASGRGHLGSMEKHAGLLSQALFSPRLWKSRLDTLNPAYYAKLDPQARKYALQSAATFTGIVTTVLGLAAAAGADVVTDPRSADFAKIKVGNTRYDILGGLQQNIRFAAQMITGEKVDSTTGKVQTLGPDRGFGKPSRYDLARQFIENKENPVLSYATKVLNGTDPTGKPINPLAEAGKLFVPLGVQGAYDTIKDTGSVTKGLALNAPNTFGIGVQTYGTKATKDSGKGLTQDSNGKYTVQLGTDNKKFDTAKEAQLALDKYNFGQSGKNIQVIGDTVLRRGTDGKITTTPKLTYDYQTNTATMTRQKANNDIAGYYKTAQAQLDIIGKQLQDPTLDPLESLTLQNKADALIKSLGKYQAQGGFTKGKSAKGSSSVATKFKIGGSSKISIPKGVKARKIAYKSQKAKKLPVSKLPKIT